MEKEIKYYNLTNPQKSILMTEQYYKKTAVNNVVGRIHIEENINIELLRKTLEIMIEQNDSLRTRIQEKDGEFLQYIVSKSINDVKIIKIMNDEDEKKIIKKLSQEYIPLLNNALIRFYILSYENSLADVLFVSHHIVADAWTNTMYAEEMIRIYQNLQNNEDVKNVNNSYIHYIKEENEYLLSDKVSNDKEYWMSVYKEEPTVQFFSTVNSIKGKRETFIIQQEYANKMKLFCTENKISPQCLFMSAFAIYLAKISSSNSIVIGMPVLNRKNHFNKKTMGMFIETVPFYINVNRNSTVKEFLDNITQTQFSLLKHHRYPYQMLQKDIKEKFNLNQKTYSVAFSYQNAKVRNANELKFNTSWEFNGYCVDDLQIHVSDLQDIGIFNVYYDYKSHGIERKEISNIHIRLLNIIEQILEEPTIQVKAIEIVTEEEKKKIEYEFNNTDMDYPKNETIVGIINKISLKYPNNFAVCDNNRKITYKELNDESNKLGQLLLSENIKNGDVVGILLSSKNVDLIVSALAVLKIGASFIFLYNGLPTERIEHILKDSNAKALITDKNNEEIYKFIQNINIENKNEYSVKELNMDISSNNVAYLIYTSGTTGKPKGIEIRNKNLINFIYSFNEKFNKSIIEKDNFISITNISFDVSIAEIFTPLFFGATLYLYKDLTTSTIEKLVNYIKNKKITFAYFPPAMLNNIADELLKYKNEIVLNKMLVGVEPIVSEVLEKYLEVKSDMQIINGYGPSETTICSTMYKFNERKDNEEIVPIGSPLKNTKIYIMNSDKNILPVNYVGELYISGDGVGKGYKCNEKLTSEKYLEINGKRIFKTGDLGKWNKDGNIIFVGRNDNQVKFRGYRIDLGEIENTLKTCTSVENAVLLLAKENYKEEKLIAFIILKENLIIESLREVLAKTLPYYMLPSTFIEMDKFPLTVNGKIDRKMLLSTALQNKENKIIVEPQTNTEKLLYEKIKRKVNCEEISIDDNFFDIGIDSLQAIELTVEFEKENYIFSLQDFYNCPTIRLLARKLDDINQRETTKEINYLENIKYVKDSTETIDGDILLLGATGFLGIHILKELLEQTSYNIYCLIRAASKLGAKERIKEKIDFYFDEEFYEKYKNRISVVKGDFTDLKFGLNNNDYKEIVQKAKILVNSAACVKHYGNSKYFNNINNLSVKKALDFCKSEDKQFIQISTISVLSDCKNVEKVDETVLYRNQNLDNIYIKTKFEAEQLIANAINNGVRATIFRIGNIMWREDGKFQENEDENSFILKLKSMLKYRIISKDVLNQEVDFSPVNLCAKAVVTLLLNNKFNVYHIENCNKIKISDLINLFSEIGFKIKLSDKTEYMNLLSSLANSNELITLIENNLNNVNIDSSKTNKELETYNFNWNKITEEYLKKYVLNM